MLKKEYRSRAMRRFAALWTVLVMTSALPVTALADGPGGSSTPVLSAGSSVGPGAENPSSGAFPNVTGDYETLESTVRAGQSIPTTGGSGTAVQTAASTDVTAAAANVSVPSIDAQGAALYDVTHGQFLFEKNGDTKFYPASITKVMTALLAAENLDLNQTLTVSESAISNMESGAVTAGVKAGDTFAAKDVLYGMWLKSANELANVLAESVSGSVSAFVEKMNQRAQAIGAVNTHFSNTNGLNNAQHLTTAHDYALITAEAFKNSTVVAVASTLHYTLPATATESSQYLTMGHKMLNPASAYYYDAFVGGKTGYTSKAGNTLTSVAEKDGVRLVAVILKSNSTHYPDTRKLFDYGFAVAKNLSSASNVNSGSASGPGGSASGPGASNVSSPGAGGSTGSAGQRIGSRWVEQNDGRWKFLKADGTYASGETLRIKSHYYTFGGDGIMLTGWQKIDGYWRSFRSEGSMRTNGWIETNGLWYYVGETGAMLTNTTTPDGYTVNADGVWVQQ